MRAGVVLIGVVLAIAACNGEKGGATGETGASGEPTFTRVKAEVLTTCAISACHAADGYTTPSQTLTLPPGEEHARLVNVESTGSPGQILVVPGDPDASYMLLKMQGAPGIVGSPMPPPFGDNPPAHLQLVRDWIAAGALDD